MDVLRACYRKRMYFDQARSVVQVVDWYFVPDTFPFWDGENAFCSEVYDGVKWYGDPPGEDPLDARIYTKGHMPAPFNPLAGRFCGQRSWFTDGAPSDAPPVPRTPGGIPACCFPAGLTGGYDLGYSPGWNRLRAI